MSEKQPYRYILTGQVDLDEPIASYRFVKRGSIPDTKDMHIHECIRFRLPENFEEIKPEGETYLITEDTRTLREIGAELCARMDGRWQGSPCGILLSETQPWCLMPEMHRAGWYMSEFGYLDAERHRFYAYSSTRAEPYETYADFSKAYAAWKKSGKTFE